MPKAPTTKRRSAGRPRIHIDWERVGKMCEAGGSAVGIAAMIGCTPDTLYNRCKSELDLDFSAFSQQKKAKGDELLKSKQFQVAMSGDRTMLIWLGKQRLGQAEKQELTGKDGKPVMEISLERIAQAFLDKGIYPDAETARAAAEGYVQELGGGVN